jgi:hypothetical protein
VKCPNQLNLLKSTLDFSSTPTTPPVTLTQNFTPIRYPRHRIHHCDPFTAIVSELRAKNSFSSQNLKPSHTSLIFTHIYLLVKYRLNSKSFHAPFPVSNLLWHNSSFKHRSRVVLSLVLQITQFLCLHSLCMYLFTSHILMTM